MADIIQLLPDSVANQIAAGEVVQRPANVVKELVENAVDAGATAISVLITDAGRTAIRVIDNGKGMSETDARLSFERHATSKIRTAADLFSLHTMGFRGEALASIAAVAQVELRTRQATDDIGTTLTIEGGLFKGQSPCSCSIGCDFNVQNLFYNVPARRKFLKADSTERNNIITAFQRIALVYPNISFTLYNNDTETFSLRAASLKQRIVNIFGKKLDQDLLPISIDTSLCRIEGFVGKPESAKKKGVLQYFFVNQRYMKHPYFNKAVATAYERLILAGEQIPYFIYFEVPPENIDVNINPTKTEIKFENEQAIWQILSSAIREAVGLNTEFNSINFETEDRPDIPVFNPSDEVLPPQSHINTSFNPFHATSGVSRNSTHSQRINKMPTDWQSLYTTPNVEIPQKETLLFPIDDHANGNEEPMLTDVSPTHYQYKGMYIMTAVKSGLMIIDQHRAHVRVLYELYLNRLHENKTLSEKLMFPETITFTTSEIDTAKTIMPQLCSMGFELEEMKKGVYAVNSVPAGLDNIDMVGLLHEIVDRVMENGSEVTDEVNKTLALGLAQKAAICYGEIMNNDEMDSLINSLFSCSNTNYTPDGHTITCILKQHNIEHMLP